MKTATGVQVGTVFASLVLGFTVAAAPGPGHAESTLEQIQKRGKLLAGVRFDSPPNGYIDTKGNHVGFGPDIAREFARHLGVEVAFIQVTSKSRIPLLLNGQIDAEINATTPNKTRDEVVDFSYTYNLEQAVVLVPKGQSTDPKDYYDTDKIVGQLQGSFFVDLWKAQSPDANIKEYQEFPELVIALAQGKVDVVPAPEILAFEMIQKLGERAEGIEMGGVFFQDPQAIALRENDSDWRDWINWALQRMWADGTFHEIYKKHYKREPAFKLGDAGRLQPGVEKIAKEGDPWAQPAP